MPFSLIPFLLIAIPISEIAVFILIGGQIGVLWTLALILVTAIMGSILLRIQGFQVLARLRSDIDAGRIPGKDLGHGAMILAAGLLLLTPGFVTDTIGFLFFVPAIRSSIWNFLSARVRIIGAGPSQGVDSGAHREGQHRSAQDADVVDLDPDDFKRRDDSPNPNSPWRSGESVSISQPDNSREPGGTRSS